MYEENSNKVVMRLSETRGIDRFLPAGEITSLARQFGCESRTSVYYALRGITNSPKAKDIREEGIKRLRALVAEATEELNKLDVENCL